MADVDLKRRFDEIDYGWRPASYWDPADNPLAVLLTNVKGEERRKLIREHYEEGTLDQLPDMLKQEELSDELVTWLSTIGPNYMGGEFLPEYEPGEIEIARISLASTTSDVISVRARPVDEGIGYRVVDEYNAEFYIHPDESERPLTLEELIGLIDEGECSHDDDASGYGLALGKSAGKYEWHSSDPYASEEEMLEDSHTFASVSSDIYQQLGKHYDGVTDAWYESVRAELADSDEET